jgi:GDP-L-fucose synthase
MNKKSKILVTGGNGMVGRSLVKRLNEGGYERILVPKSGELDLRNQEKVERYFEKNKSEYVFHLAARVGGIEANIENPGEFLHDNLVMQSNVIENARKFGVEKLLFLGSSCIYPRECAQPMKEEDLLTGKLEPTNEGYALAKIAGLKLCEYFNQQYGTNFMSLMPCNLYGPNDHFDLERGHVMSALMLKFHEAKEKNSPEMEVWGTGKAIREFLFVEDLADAMVYFMSNYDAKDLGPFVNIGSGEAENVRDLAFTIKKVVGYAGEVRFNTDKPDGMPRKSLDVTKAEGFGWKAKTSLKEGIERTYAWYKENG